MGSSSYSTRSRILATLSKVTLFISSEILTSAKAAITELALFSSSSSQIFIETLSLISTFEEPIYTGRLSPSLRPNTSPSVNESMISSVSRLPSSTSLSLNSAIVAPTPIISLPFLSDQRNSFASLPSV